jgi:hypothetical protein
MQQSYRLSPFVVGDSSCIPSQVVRSSDWFTLVFGGPIWGYILASRYYPVKLPCGIIRCDVTDAIYLFENEDVIKNLIDTDKLAAIIEN